MSNGTKTLFSKNEKPFMRLLIIVRGSNTGLGYQTLNLAKMLNPYRIMYIDCSGFNPGYKQHPEWYQGYQGYYIKGFPTDQQASQVLDNITHLLTCETPYNYNIINYARLRGIKTYIQANWEFLDYAHLELPLPTKFLMPSYWHLEDMRRKYNYVEYLPPPIFPQNFEEAKSINLNSVSNNILHVMGKKAEGDRNGTEILLEALKYTKSDFNLTITSQQKLEIPINDTRVRIISKNIEEQQKLYENYDLMILPRRYGGLCMPMNEALTSGVPVFMTNCSPNNKVLPKEWLIPAQQTGQFRAKQDVEIFDSNPQELAKMIDDFMTKTYRQKIVAKKKAYQLSKQYHVENLKDRYIEALK